MNLVGLSVVSYLVKRAILFMSRSQLVATSQELSMPCLARNLVLSLSTWHGNNWSYQQFRSQLRMSINWGLYTTVDIGRYLVVNSSSILPFATQMLPRLRLPRLVLQRLLPLILCQ